MSCRCFYKLSISNELDALSLMTGSFVIMFYDMTADQINQFEILEIIQII